LSWAASCADDWLDGDWSGACRVCEDSVWGCWDVGCWGFVVRVELVVTQATIQKPARITDNSLRDLITICKIRFCKFGVKRYSAGTEIRLWLPLTIYIPAILYLDFKYERKTPLCIEEYRRAIQKKPISAQRKSA
jgi:hypothetical protein